MPRTGSSALRPALAGNAVALAAAPWVEADEARQLVVDRWLLRLAGRIAVWASPLRRMVVWSFARRVLACERRLLELGDRELASIAKQTGDRLRREGLVRDAVVEAFALVREVSRRRLGRCHYPVQVMGGKVLLDGGIAEMATGEGKTLTALLPAVTMALAGVPVHVITVNEYLAARDAQTLEPVYAFFGLVVGRVLPDQQPAERAAAYRCDIVYCVNKDLTFDYLRDRIEVLAGRIGARAVAASLAAPGAAPKAPLLRGLWYAVVDEVDSVLIDEARTPLIISRNLEASREIARADAALALAAGLESGHHFEVGWRDRQVTLSGQGRAAAQTAADPRLPAALVERERLIEQALAALICHERDRHYIVADGKVQIVDEYTGRVMPDRAWEGGLHQLVERKEGLDPTAARDTIARITYQRMFRRYLRVAGMSGTVTEVAGELKMVLGCATLRIPTHRGNRRRDLGTRMFRHGAERDRAVVAAALAMTAGGRAVLIGTRSVAASERIAALCRAAGLAPQVLNARQDADEALVVAAAGQVGRVTVATNMAGRGTDIELAAAVRAAGGLHVILTEFHDSTRIDRQLFGRAGRQGDPGSCEALVAITDELFSSHADTAARRISGWAELGGWKTIPPLLGVWLRRAAQRRAESHHAEIRHNTLAQERQTDRLLAFAGRPE